MEWLVTTPTEWHGDVWSNAIDWTIAFLLSEQKRTEQNTQHQIDFNNNLSSVKQ